MFGFRFACGMRFVDKKANPQCPFMCLYLAVDVLLEDIYSGTSLIRTPMGQNKVSSLVRCPYFRG